MLNLDSQLQKKTCQKTRMERIDWLDEESLESEADTEEHLFQVFNSFRNAVAIPKGNVLYMSENENCPCNQASSHVQRLIENIDFTKINVFIWATTEMVHTTQSGIWTKTKYQDNEGDHFRKIRQLCQYLNIPAENVIFLVPGDDFLKEKLAEFVGNLFSKHQYDKPLVCVWFEVKDHYYQRQLQRMLYH